MTETSTDSVNLSLSEEEMALLKVMIYFDVFQYPLKPSEILAYAPIKMSPLNVVPCLNFLVNNGLVRQVGNYFGLRVDQAQIDRRTRGAAAAEKMMKYAHRFTRLMRNFPFVRGICISGSLSKGFCDEQGDIDYFVITAPGRLWLARTALLAFKKVFLLNRKKFFCVNYLIDTEHLEIPDRNEFTATEIVTLIPTYDRGHYEAFMEANRWVEAYRPNFINQRKSPILRGRSTLQLLMEFVLGNAVGNWLDKKCMHLTMKRWERRFGDFHPDDFELTMRSRKYVSKHHPQNFQSRVMAAIRETRQSLASTHGIKFD